MRSIDFKISFRNGPDLYFFLRFQVISMIGRFSVDIMFEYLSSNKYQETMSVHVNLTFSLFEAFFIYLSPNRS